MNGVFKMRYFPLNILITLGCSILFACSISGDQNPEPSLYATFIFNEDTEGWQPGYAEYEAGTEDTLQFNFTHGTFKLSSSPDSVTAAVQSGYSLNGQLFMFMKQKIGGLEPGTEYLVAFSVALYAQVKGNFDDNLVTSTDGSYLKAGGFSNEPDTVLTEDPENAGNWLVKTDFDKGETGKSGLDLLNLGKMQYTLKSQQPIILGGDSSNNLLTVRSDQDGKMWIVIGVDTNIPVNLDVYYSYIQIQFIKRS